MSALNVSHGFIESSKIDIDLLTIMLQKKQQLQSMYSFCFDKGEHYPSGKSVLHGCNLLCDPIVCSQSWPTQIKPHAVTENGNNQTREWEKNRQKERGRKDECFIFQSKVQGHKRIKIREDGIHFMHFDIITADSLYTVLID